MVFALEQIKTRVLDRYPYFGSVVASVCFKESFSVEAFATDGENFYCNPRCIERFSQDDLTFLFAHELCHIAFNHIARSKNKNLRLWCIASDAVVNALLISDGLKPVPGAVILPEALNCDAEQLYLLLLEKEPPQKDGPEKKERKLKDDFQSSSNSGSESQSNEDSQSSLSDGKDSKKSESGNKKSKNKLDDQSGGAPDQNDDDPNTADMGDGAHSLWDKPCAKENADGQDEAPPEPDENSDDDEIIITNEQRKYHESKVKRKTQIAELKDALSNQASGAGTSTNSDKRQIGGIGETKALMDWRRALREEICFDVDWSYKNAEIENGVVTPHLEEMPYPVTEILLDTSGSIEASLLKSFLRECKGILQSSQIRVGCFDVIFYGFQEIRKEKDIDEMVYKGGGGTNFTAAVNAFSRRVTNKIIFTDGDAPMPETPMDAIWVVFGMEEIRPIGGRVIRITPEQLNALMAGEK